MLMAPRLHPTQLSRAPSHPTVSGSPSPPTCQGVLLFDRGAAHVEHLPAACHGLWCGARQRGDGRIHAACGRELLHVQRAACCPMPVLPEQQHTLDLKWGWMRTSSPSSTHHHISSSSNVTFVIYHHHHHHHHHQHHQQQQQQQRQQHSSFYSRVLAAAVAAVLSPTAAATACHTDTKTTSCRL